MPSGPEGFVSDAAYATEFGKAKALLLAHPGRWRIIYHYDGDGIASASCAARALLRLGYGFQATPLQGVERHRMADLLKGYRGPTLVVDTGATWVDLYVEHPAPVIVLDHHKYPSAPTPPAVPGHVAFVNPLDWGVDGMVELCAASLTWLFTVFLDPANWDNAPWGLSGAIADRQHPGGFRGLNRTLLDGAVERGLVVPRPGLALIGPTVARAIERSVDPYFRGLSGRAPECRAFVEGLGLAPHRPLGSLEPTEANRLASALLARLNAQGVRPEFAEMLTEPAYAVPALGTTANELSILQNATGRVGEPGVGIALALGDPAARERAAAAETAWRDGVLAGLRRIEDDGVHAMPALQWFESPETTLAGTQAGLAMNYLVDPRRPIFVRTAAERALKVSARGTLHLVDAGLDLASACRTAAGAVGGEGGGHQVAAGATIPLDRWEPFLAEANRLIAAQLPVLVDGGP